MVIEALYYKHKGWWRKDKRMVVQRSATVWQEKVRKWNIYYCFPMAGQKLTTPDTLKERFQIFNLESS